MKKKLIIFILCVLTSNIYSQKTAGVLIKTFKAAETVSEIKSIMDGDTVSGLCSIMSMNPVLCGILSVTDLNSNERAELDEIKSKYQLEQFLSKKGISSEEFYQKLYEHRNSTQFQYELKK